MRFWKALVVLLPVAAGVAGGWQWYAATAARTETPAARPATPPATAVEAGPVKVDTVVRIISAVGTLDSNEAVIVRPEIAGRIAEILFREGQAVKAGAPLFRLEDSILKAELAQVRANLRLAERNFERTKELFERSAGTARAFDEASAKLDADRAALTLAEARLAKSLISAPFGGVVGLRRVSVGDYVTPGQALVNLEAIDPVKVEFRIAETNLGLLAVGQNVRLRVDAFPAGEFTGEVYAIDPRLDADGRSVAIRARVPNPDGLLRPGLFAQVNLLVERRDNAIIVPEQAIWPRGDDHFVFRVVDGRAVLTKVDIGIRRQGEVEILSGLSRDAVVVTAGQVKIRDGSAVRPVAPSGKS